MARMARNIKRFIECLYYWSVEASDTAVVWLNTTFVWLDTTVVWLKKTRFKEFQITLRCARSANCC